MSILCAIIGKKYDKLNPMLFLDSVKKHDNISIKPKSYKLELLGELVV